MSAERRGAVAELNGEGRNFREKLDRGQNFKQKKRRDIENRDNPRGQRSLLKMAGGARRAAKGDFFCMEKIDQADCEKKAREDEDRKQNFLSPHRNRGNFKLNPPKNQIKFLGSDHDN